MYRYSSVSGSFSGLPLQNLSVKIWYITAPFAQAGVWKFGQTLKKKCSSGASATPERSRQIIVFPLQISK